MLRDSLQNLLLFVSQKVNSIQDSVGAFERFADASCP